MVRIPSLIIAVRNKLSAVVVTKHAIVAYNASHISRDEKPSRYASGTHIMAYTAVNTVQETISTSPEVPLQDE